MRLTRRTVAVTGATAAACVLGASLAYAAVPQTSGVINGCYSPTSGALRVTGNGACKAGENHVNWNGTTAQSSTLVTGPGMTVGFSSTQQVTVTCPAGKLVLGTGLRNVMSNGATNSYLSVFETDISDNRRSVSVFVRNNSPAETALVTTVYAQATCG